MNQAIRPEQSPSNEDLPSVDENPKLPEIELEVFETEDISKFLKEEPEQFCTNEGIKIENDKREKFECKDCDEIFQNESNLKEHVDNFHQDVSGVKPNSQTSTKQRSKDKIFKCDHLDCGKSFDRRSNLILHTQRHRGDKPFTCKFDGCHESFKLKDYLRKHKKNHELGRQYRCPVDKCTAAYFKIHNLKDHIRAHKGERFFCTYADCDSSYGRKDRLNEHLRKHRIMEESNKKEKHDIEGRS